jgi:hypothetical protein
MVCICLFCDAQLSSEQLCSPRGSPYAAQWLAIVLAVQNVNDPAIVFLEPSKCSPRLIIPRCLQLTRLTRIQNIRLVVLLERFASSRLLPALIS